MPNTKILTQDGQEFYPVTHESLVVGLNSRPYDSQTPNGMGYKVLEKDKTFAEQVVDENTIYEIRYDFVLTSAFTIPSGCILRFNGGSISGSSIVYQNTIIDGEYYKKINSLASGTLLNAKIDPFMFGATGDGVTDDSVAFSGLCGCVNSQSGKEVVIPAGHYIVNQMLDITESTVIKGLGADTSILDFSTKNDGNQTDFSLRGTYSQLSITLTSAADVGARTISVSDSSEFNVGDIIFILDDADGSFFPADKRTPGAPYYRPDAYKQGEILKVAAVSTGTLTLETSLFGSYPTATTVFYKGNMKTFSVSDISILSKETGSATGAVALRLDYCANSKVSGVKLSGTNNAHIGIYHSFNGHFDNCVIDYPSVNIGTNYGIIIANSQDMTIRDCDIRTQRHAITTGGSIFIPIVNRNIKVFGGHYRGVETNRSEVSVVDNHENTEWFSISNATIDGAVRLSGDHLSITNCQISGKSNPAKWLVMTDGIGTDITVEGNKLYFDDEPKGYAGYFSLINCDYRRTIIDSGKLIIKNNVLLLNGSSNTGYDISIYGIIFTPGTYITPSCIVISDNDLIFNGQNPILGYGIYIGDVAKEILIKGNNFFGCTFYSKWINSVDTSLFIIGNTFQRSTMVRAVDVRGPHGYVLVIKGNLFFDRPNSGQYCIGLRELTTKPKQVLIEENIFQNIRAGMIFDSTSVTLDELLIFRNTFYNSVTVANTCWGSISNVSTLKLCDNYSVGIGDFAYSNVTSIEEISHPCASTSSRPTTNLWRVVGKPIFDTTLGKMIVWNGTAWVNMDGTALS